MTATRRSIHDTPSLHAMIACFEIDGVARNVTVVDEQLNQALVLTPPTIPNPEHVALAKKVEAAALALADLGEQLAHEPASLPNPDRLAIEDRVFAVAEAQLDAEKATEIIHKADAAAAAAPKKKTAKAGKKK